MSLTAFRRREIARHVEDLRLGGAITATPADVPRILEDLTQLLRDHEAMLTEAARIERQEIHSAR